MKKDIAKLTAISMAFMLMLTGCSLGGKKPDAAVDASTEANTEVAASSNQESTGDASAEASSNQLVVLEDLAEPELDESASAANSISDAASEDATKYNIDKELKMVFIGDSQFANGRNDGSALANMVQYRVPNSIAYNLGVGGSTAALESSTSDYQDYENWTSSCFLGICYAMEGRVDRNKVCAALPDVLYTMNQIDPGSVDYYFIEYGANDFFTKVPLDKWSAGNENINELYTYYGALKAGIEVLKSISPDATIVLITPFYGIYKAPDGTYLGDSYITSNGFATLQDYAKKINNVAEEQGIYCLDTMFHAKCDLYLDTADQYLMDNVHLSLVGRQIFGRLIAHIPNSMEGYEPSAYRQTEDIKIAEFDPNEYYKYPDEYFQRDFPEEYEKYMNGEYLLAKPE